MLWNSLEIKVFENNQKGRFVVAFSAGRGVCVCSGVGRPSRPRSAVLSVWLCVSVNVTINVRGRGWGEEEENATLV
jgi:hypothetical protein